MARRGKRIEVPVVQVEYDEGGNTIWVQDVGGTVLRIKCSGKVTSTRCRTSPVSHSDILVDGDINVCLASRAAR